MAVWDGGGAGGQSGAAGTAVNIGIWHSLGLPADVLTPDGETTDPALAPIPGCVKPGDMVDRCSETWWTGWHGRSSSR